MSNLRNKNIADHDATELETNRNKLKTQDLTTNCLLKEILWELKELNFNMRIITDQDEMDTGDQL